MKNYKVVEDIVKRFLSENHEDTEQNRAVCIAKVYQKGKLVASPEKAIPSLLNNSIQVQWAYDIVIFSSDAFPTSLGVHCTNLRCFYLPWSTLYQPQMLLPALEYTVPGSDTSTCLESTVPASDASICLGVHCTSLRCFYLPWSTLYQPQMLLPALEYTVPASDASTCLGVHCTNLRCFYLPWSTLYQPQMLLPALEYIVPASDASTCLGVHCTNLRCFYLPWSTLYQPQMLLPALEEYTVPTSDASTCLGVHCTNLRCFYLPWSTLYQPQMLYLSQLNSLLLGARITQLYYLDCIEFGRK